MKTFSCLVITVWFSLSCRILAEHHGQETKQLKLEKVATINAGALIHELIFSPDDKLFAAAYSEARQVDLFDLTSRKKVEAIEDPTMSLTYTCDFLKGKKLLVFGASALNDVQAYGYATIDLETKKLMQVDLCCNLPFNTIRVSPDQMTIAAGDHNGVLRLFRSGIGINSRSIQIQSKGDRIRFVKFRPDSRSVVVDGPEGSIVVVDVESGQTEPISKLSPNIVGVDFVSNDKFVTVNTEGDRSLVDIKNREVKRIKLDMGGKTFTCFTYLQKQRVIVSGHSDGRIAIWDLATGNKSGEIVALRGGAIDCIVANKAGTALVVGATTDGKAGLVGNVIIYELNP
jgi:WD40 repeat protein